MYNNSFDYTFWSAILRILMIVASAGCGFAIGWLISPHSRGFRKKALIVFGVILVLTALFMNNFVGWNAAVVVSFVGFIYGIVFWMAGLFSGLLETPTTFGSSRWASADDVTHKKLYGASGIRIGEFKNEADDGQNVISYKGDRHLLTVAPTRSGKGTTQIIPNLLTYEGSMLVIDPKGENALTTALRRKEMGQEVHIVDPWGIADVEGIAPSTFNPLDWLDPTDNEITENAMILADALVVGDNHSDSFWNEEAKALLQGLLLFVASDDEEDGSRHLGRVREHLLKSDDEQEKLFQDMARSGHRIISSTGHRCLQKEKKLLSNVIASAQAQTHFLDSERLNDKMMASSFKFEDLKSKPMTIYLVLPADRLSTFGRWLRLLVQQAVTVNARNIETQPAKPVLFILDEFAALGRLSMIEQAFGLMAGFGMQLWGIVQDFNQLERIYGDGWQSFVANAGMINYFGSSDQKTAEYFSSLCGEQTVWNLSSALSTAVSGKTVTNTETDTRAASQRKLAYPDELMRMKDGNQLVFVENMHPMIAQKVRWFDDPMLKKLGVDLHAIQADTQTVTAEDALNEGLTNE